MKINQQHVDNVSIGSSQDDEIQAGIDQENIGLVLTMASANLYSNPIGSFIRELTTNAVDANVDAGVDNPVLVTLDWDVDGYFVSFKDEGIGMSPEVFKNIFNNWFSSTKRGDNKAHGGWGLGSKSPLAYQDDFEITTIYDGIKYEYIYAKADPVPTSTLINKEETDEPNGTTIKVAIKSGDAYTVSRELREQLAYFKNVFVENKYEKYDNDFKLYNSEDYILKNRNRPYTDMHLLLGQVSYPIDWNVLNLSVINLPIAIKFEIGELDVTLSRENINYTERTIQKLKTKIQAVYKKILDKFEEQFIITDIKDYIYKRKHEIAPKIKIADLEFSVTGITYNNWIFQPFEGLNISGYIDSNIFANYDIYTIKKGKHKLVDYNAYFHILRQDIYYAEKLNYFDSKFLDNGLVFTKKKKINKRTFKILAAAIGRYHFPDSGKYHQKDIIEVGTSKILMKLLPYLEKEIVHGCKKYDGLASPEWIRAEKAKEKEYKEKVKGEITTYNLQRNRTPVNLRRLVEDNKAVFYADINDDTNKLVHYDNLYRYNNDYFRKNCKLIFASKTTITKLKRLDNTYPVEDMLKAKSVQGILRRVAFSHNFKEKLVFRNSCLDCLDNLYSEHYTVLNRNTINFTTREYDVKNKGGKILDYDVNLYTFFKDTIEELVRKNPLLVFPYKSKDRVVKYIDESYINKLHIITEPILFARKIAIYNGAEKEDRETFKTILRKRVAKALSKNHLLYH